MKRLNALNSRRSLKKAWSIGSLILSLIAFNLIACQNQQSKDNVNQNPYLQNGAQSNMQVFSNGSQYTSSSCTNCPVNLSVYYNQLGLVYKPWDRLDTTSMEWNLNLKGDGSKAFGQNDSRIAYQYSGLMTIEANARILQNDNYLCNAPTGDYVVRTITAGSHAGGRISNIKFEMISSNAVNGGINTYTRILGTISNGFIMGMVGWSSLPTDVNARLSGQMTIESVNGKACQRTITLQ